MPRFIPLSVLLAAGLLTASSAVAADIDFSHEIVPVLRKYCGKCHMGVKKQGGFSMNTREAFLAGGEAGGRGPGEAARPDRGETVCGILARGRRGLHSLANDLVCAPQIASQGKPS